MGINHDPATKNRPKTMIDFEVNGFRSKPSYIFYLRSASCSP